MAFYTHFFNPERGALDTDQYSETVPMHTGVSAVAGELLSVNTSGEFIAGAPAGKMPYWAMSASDDPDVDNTNNYFASGDVLAIVGVAPYQIATTEYVTTSSYTPGALLMAATGGDAGKIDVRTSGNDVVGVIGKEATVSKTISNETATCLVFWLCWRPVIS